MSHFCHNCGYQISRIDASFCGHCGVKLIKLKPHESRNESEVVTRSNFLEEMKQIVTHFVDDLKDVDSTEIPSSQNDESVIDVTGSYGSIEHGATKERQLVQFSNVPKWEHMYVYSRTDIEYANNDQRKFYAVFRDSFLKGVYLDIEGNYNYAFILLFDLLHFYESHRDLHRLETQYERLKLICPKTESYSRSFLTDLMKSAGDHLGAERINTQYYKERNEYFGNEYWTLGKKYKKELKPSKYEELLLRNISDPNNVFCDIEFCFIEVLRLLLKVIDAVDKSYEESTDFDGELKELLDAVVVEHYRCGRRTANYRYTFESVKREFFTWMFKNCENAVREEYRHTRKLKISPFYLHINRCEAQTDEIRNRVVTILPSMVSTLASPDKETERNLNALSTTRWKADFKKITDEFEITDLDKFKKRVNMLGELNGQNPSVENIYFEASKFLAKKDRRTSLEMYLRYIYTDLHSDVIQNKQHTKTIQKALFSTNEQLHEFESIISRLFVERDLEKALKAVPEIYETKRKRIKLSRGAVQKVQSAHAETVELLNEYLDDEFEDADTKISSKENDQEEIEIKIISKTPDTDRPMIANSVGLSSTHLEMLEVFEKSKLEVSASDLDAFAKSHGVFKNQLIDEVNDVCFDLLDDVLIEEEDESFVIYEPYYEQIQQNKKHD